MKVLFIGGYNSLTNALAVKLLKNKINIAVLNDEKDKPKFNMRYTSYTSDMDHVVNVLANYRPDIVLVTTFYDKTYSLGDLEAILSQSASYGIRRVIFFSSTCVYGIQPEEAYLPVETDPAAPAGKMSVEFAAAEKLCDFWGQSSPIQVTVLRLAMLYGVNAGDLPLNEWINELLDGKTVELPVHANYAFLHMDDLAEAVLQMVNAAFSPIYNVVSGTTVSASQLVRMLTSCLNLKDAKLELKIGVKSHYFAASNALLRREYEWHERHNLKSDLPILVNEISEQNKKADKAAKKKSRREQRDHDGKMNPIAMLENLLLFALTVFLTLNQSTMPLIGNTNFIALYLILIAVSMNLQQSALSLLLSVFLLVYQQVLAGHDVFTAIISSQTMLKTAEYCIIGISVSYVIHRMRARYQFLQMDQADLLDEMKAIEQFSEDNLRTRHLFEDQILEYEVSLPRIISMTARLDTLEPESIIPETMKILAESVNVEDVAAYMIGSQGGRMRLSYSTTSAARVMGQSPTLEDYQSILSVLESDQVFTNRDMNPAFPAMASGVKMNERLAFVFVVWNIPFQKMGLDTANLLQAITRMVSAALQRAFQYEELTRSERYLPESNIMRYAAFKRLCEIRGAENADSGDILCCVSAPGMDLLQLSKQVGPLVRENDYMGDSGRGSLLLLLSGTSMEGFYSFRNRLDKYGLNCDIMEATVMDSALAV